MKRLIIAIAISLASSGFGADFEKDIAPILEAQCLSCHNAQEAKGDVILETRKDAAQVLSAGKPHTSELLAAVQGPKPEMPKKAEPLSADQVRLLREWIETGATWPADRTLVFNPERNLDWWSLSPIVGNPPSTDGHPVDAFIEAALKENALEPVEPASPEVLIRRLTYDLTGLPPTLDAVDRFLQAWATDPGHAWNVEVDHLLASPEFGEKWAQHWLDLARYAETHGYDKDKPRMNAWPYRDYVIRSLNEDKPFPRFVEEQVAGDVLFPEDPDGVLGLGFLAAGPWDFIGHWEVGEAKLDGRIAKHLDRDEMVSAVFNVFQSTTVQCAQCHHHKFDPVRMEDYYRLHSVFAAVDRADRVYEGLSPEQQARKQGLIARVNELKAEQETIDSQLKRLLAARVSGIDRRTAELKEKYGTSQKPQYGYHSSITSNPNEEKWVQVDLGEPRSVSQVRLIPSYDRFADIGAGFGFPVRFKVEASNDPDFESDVRLLLDATQADQPNPKSRTVLADVAGEKVRFIRLTATKLRERKNDYMLALGELEVVDDSTGENYALGAMVAAKDSIEQKVRWSKANLVDGIFHRELSNEAALAELHQLQEERSQIVAELQPPSTQIRLEQIKEDLAQLNKDLNAFPEGEVVYAAATHFSRGGRFTATEGKPRPIHLLHRGDLRAPGELQSPGAPPLWETAPETFFDSNSWDEGEARAELAHYLTRQDNPLLWRSIANRVWQWTFGAPLVGTPNDFGRMGMTPTHPELLDYLAARLRDDPEHSLKRLIRHLVTSNTYQRSSTHHPGNAALDADNAYLWRANRRRLTAEELRDSLLAASGALRLEERGGPSFQDFVIEKPQHSPHYEYHLHDPENPAAHRRSVYRFIVRSQPHPMLTTLDCADPSISVPERDESTTALQALTQWNNRLIEAMSRRLAERMEAEAPADLEGRLDYACRLVLGRSPNPSEKEILTGYLEKHGEASLARVLFNTNAFTYIN